VDLLHRAHDSRIFGNLLVLLVVCNPFGASILMSLSHLAEKFGPPSLKLAGLQLWVHSRPSPASKEPSEADALNVTAHCGSPGASVSVSGAFLDSWSFASFARECKALHASLDGIAILRSDEPDLCVTLAAGRTGHVSMIVDITPDPMNQQHRFEFSELDQTYLPAIISQCAAVLDIYPTAFSTT